MSKSSFTLWITILLCVLLLVPSVFVQDNIKPTECLDVSNATHVSTNPSRGPLSGKKIVVSAGHGLYNHETYGWIYQREYNYSGWGITEDIVNAEIAMHLCNYLERAGASVYSTRELNKTAGNGISGYPKWKEAAKYYIQSQGAPSWVYNDPNVTTELSKDLRSRPNYANWLGADLSISIHNNACDSHNARGTSILYDVSHSNLAGANENLANIVHDKVYEKVRGYYDPAWPWRNVVETNNQYGEIRLCNMPSLIVECAFYDNYTDNQALHSEVFKMAVARGIFEGICEFFGVLPNGLYGAKIFIDPGHGLYNHETNGWIYQRSNYWGIIEDLVNDEIAAYLVPMLRMEGANVTCSREIDKNAGLGVSGYSKWREGTKYYAESQGLPSSVWNYGSDELTKDLYSRSNWANYIQVDLFVSLHNNANNGLSSGTLTLWEQNTDYGTVHATRAQYAASRIHARTLYEIRTNFLSSWVNLGCQETESYLGHTLAVQRRTNAPAPLIEFAFFDKQSPDNDALHSEYFKMLCAYGTYRGICDYFAQYPPSPVTPEYPKVEITSPKGFSIVGGTVKVAATYTCNSSLAWSALRINESIVAYDNSTPISFNLNTSVLEVGPKIINLTVCNTYGLTASYQIYVNVQRNIALETGVYATSNALIDDYDSTSSYASTTWNANPPGSHTIVLPSPRYIYLIKTHLWDGDYRFYRYYIETSLDNLTWTRAVDRTTGIHSSWQYDFIKPLPAKYVRITGTYNSANNWFHVIEMQLFALVSQDTIPPSSCITSNVPTIVSSSTFWLEGDCSDLGGSGVDRVEVNINEGGWIVAEPSYLHSDGSWDRWKFCYRPNENGVVSIRCRAIDRAGNCEIPPHSTCTFTVALQSSIPIEARGVWADRWHVSSPAYIDSLIQAAKDSNMNIVTIQVLGEGYALYRTSLLPRYPGIPSDFDVLRYTLDKAHKEGLEVHAWINTLAVGTTNNASSYPAKHVIHDHNDWIAVDESGAKDKGSADSGGYGYVDLCPGRSEVKNYLVNVTLELAQNYPDLDAIHLDYIRYSHANSTYANERHCYCDVCKARYENEYGYSGTWPPANDHDWCEFRRGLVTEIVKAIYENVTSYNWKIKVGAAVWGNYSDGCKYYLQDSHKWMQMGIIDYIAPMMYSVSDSGLADRLTNPSYGHVVHSYGRHVYSGLGADTSGSPYHEPSAIPSQIETSRNSGALGSWLYDSETIVEDGTTYSSVLVSSVFSIKANIPPMTWKKGTRPDEIPPWLVILSPQDGCEQTGSFLVNGYAHDFYHYDNSTGISKIEYRINQGLWNIATNDDPLGKWQNFSFICAEGVEGNNIIEVRATDMAGNSRIVKLNFSRPSENSPPIIIEVFPENGSIGVARETYIQVIFSEPVINTSISFKLVNEKTEGEVPGTFSWNILNTSLIFIPQKILEYNTTYSIVLSSVTDLSGQNMQGIFKSSFCTLLDLFPPFVVDNYPANNSIDVSLGTPIWVLFSEPMDNLSSVYSFECSNGTQEPFFASWNENNTLLFINPCSSLQPSTSYFLNLSLMFDRNGNLMQPRSFSFTTFEILDVQPPNLVYTVPSNNSVGISTTERILLRFSEVMNLYSVQQAVSIIPQATIDPSSWRQYGETITFTFSKMLDWNTTYKISIGRIDSFGTMLYARDLSGNPLPYYEFSFRTEIPSDGFFAGRVFDNQGMPIYGAEVEILGKPVNCEGYILNCTTDNLGRFNLTLPPGKYDVRVSKIGFESSIEFGIIVNPGKTSSLYFVLQGPCENVSISGFVRDYEGKALQGASVKLYISGTNEPIKSALTSSVGYYRFRNLAQGVYKIKVELSGYVTKEMVITCEQLHEYVIDIMLVEGENIVLGSIIGYVKDSDTGKPIPLAKIVLSGKVLSGNGTNTISIDVLTDAFGRFCFANLSIGNYSIYINAKGYLGTTLNDISITHTENSIELPEIWLVSVSEKEINPIPWTLIFIAISALIGIIILFILIKRVIKRQRKQNAQ